MGTTFSDFNGGHFFYAFRSHNFQFCGIPFFLLFCMPQFQIWVYTIISILGIYQLFSCFDTIYYNYLGATASDFLFRHVDKRIYNYT